MMKSDHDNKITVFTGYALKFICGDGEIDANIKLKLDHTLRVVKEAEAVAAAENFSPAELNGSFYAALFHDLSRFEQFSQYRSFRDSDSFDHGDRSAEMLETDAGWLTGVDDAARRRVTEAVRYHNKPALPTVLAGDPVACCVRDADKLDIMEFFITYLENPVNQAVVFSLDLSAPISSEILDAMRRGEVPLHSKMRSAGDFIVAKLMWAKDLNFRHTRQEFRRRRYLERLMEHLPEDPEISLFREQAEKWLDDR